MQRILKVVNRQKIVVALWVLATAGCWGLFAQADSLVLRKSKPTLVSALLTANSYTGDMTPLSNRPSLQPGLQLGLRSGAAQRLAPYLHLGFGRMVAENRALGPVTVSTGLPDPPTVLIQPNTYAETFYVHTDIGFQLNLLRSYRKAAPFLSAGLGVLAFTPRAFDGIPLVRKRSTRAPSEQSFEALALSFPLAAGFDARISEVLGLRAAYVFRPTTTDYLDNIAALGNRSGNDRLHHFQLGISYRIGDINPVALPVASAPAAPQSFAEGYSRLSDENKRLRDETAALEERLAALQPRVTELEQKIDTLQREDAEQLAELERLRNGKEEDLGELLPLQALQAENAYLIQNNDQLKRQLARAKSRSDSLESILARRDAEAGTAGLLGRIRELESRLMRCSYQQDSLRTLWLSAQTASALAISNKRNLDLTQQRLDSMTALYQGLLTTRNRLLEQLSETQDALEKCLRNSTELEKRLDAANKQKGPQEVLLSVDCKKDKTLVQSRIISYFDNLGYTYNLAGGRLMYENVNLPDLGAGQYYITLYMLANEQEKRRLIAIIRGADGSRVPESDDPAANSWLNYFVR